jgi:hypothetical protein
MKNQAKTKLRLNSQTIRSLRASGLQHVQGGRPVDDSIDVCLTDLCSAACRGCG